MAEVAEDDVAVFLGGFFQMSPFRRLEWLIVTSLVSEFDPPIVYSSIIIKISYPETYFRVEPKQNLSGSISLSAFECSLCCELLCIFPGVVAFSETATWLHILHCTKPPVSQNDPIVAILLPLPSHRPWKRLRDPIKICNFTHLGSNWRDRYFRRCFRHFSIKQQI